MSKIRRSLCFAVAISMIMSCMLSFTAFAAQAVEIDSKEAFLNLNNAPSGDYVLTCDIDFENEEFKGSLLQAFSGTLDGAGYTLKGINIKSVGSAGVIGTLNGSVKNLSVSGNIGVESTASERIDVGAVAALNCGVIENCGSHVSVDVKAAANVYVGGISGSNMSAASVGSVLKSVSDGMVECNGSKNVYVGGISGAYGSIEGCINRASVSAVSEGGGLVYAAGISPYEAAVSYCVNDASVSARGCFQVYAGGITAFFGSSARTVVSCCVNNGSISSELADNAEIDKSQARSAAGGIAAYTANTAPVSDPFNPEACTSVISDCKNTGAVSAKTAEIEIKGCAGGVVGIVNGLVKNCLNHTGDTIKGTAFGRIFGALNPSGKLRGAVYTCYSMDNGVLYSQIINGSSADTPVSAENMTDSTYFAELDFESNWAIERDDASPSPVMKSSHKHVYAATVIEPTCEEDEITVYSCSICGDEYRETEENTKLGHAWNDGVVTTAPTCTDTGVKTYTCRNDAAHTKTEPVAIDENAHRWGEYVSDNNATTEADGTKTRKCELCDKTETVVAEGTKLEPTVVEIDSNEFFTDIKADRENRDKDRWYKPYVDYVATYNLMNGMPDGSFAPNSVLTRAEFAQILANMSGVDTSNRDVTTQFTDVPAGKWYSAAVKWAADNGIVNGITATTFGPSEQIQRQHVCLMLVRYAEKFGIELTPINEKATFADDAEIGKSAKEAVYICQQAGIVTGKTETTFAPKESATRAEIATFVTRYHKIATGK